MLVSVVVITYNSSKYVIETLESIYAQTYKDIELIISDDCSKDNTVALCKRWCDSHKERFYNYDIIESERNTGIAPNVNRGYNRAKGEWIKAIAGDDLMLPDCIERYVQYSIDHPEFCIIFSRAIPFGNNKLAVDEFSKIRDQRDYFWSLPTAECQYWDLLIREACTDGPACFISKNVYSTIGGYDESIPMYEDYPFFLKATDNGFRMGMMIDRVTKYRIHDESLSYSTSRGKNYRMACAAYDVLMKYRYNGLKELDATYALFLKWYYQGQKYRYGLIRMIYFTLRMLLRLITRNRCLNMRNTSKVRKQLPESLYVLYCSRYFVK